MSHYNHMLFGGGYTLFVHHTVGGDSNLNWVRKPEHLDWNARLSIPSNAGPVSAR